MLIITLFLNFLFLSHFQTDFLSCSLTYQFSALLLLMLVLETTGGDNVVQSIISNVIIITKLNARGHRGRNRMVVGFTTTYAINAYNH